MIDRNSCIPFINIYSELIFDILHYQILFSQYISYFILVLYFEIDLINNYNLLLYSSISRQVTQPQFRVYVKVSLSGNLHP